MSSIRFRAWHKESKKMGDVIGMSWITKDFLVSVCVDIPPEKPEWRTEWFCPSFVLMQFTGYTTHRLPIADGRDEIWEGDIFEVAYGDGTCEMGVINRRPSGAWVWENEHTYIEMEDFMSSDATHRGDVYQSPELLER